MTEWISVEERLPESPSWVLVYADGTINCMGYDGKWEDWTLPRAGNIIVEFISHWMLLPEPPEEAEQAA